MRSISFIGSIATAETSIHSLRQRRSMSDTAGHWSVVIQTQAALGDVVDLATASVPLPVIDDPRAFSNDRSVREAVELLSEDPVSSPPEHLLDAAPDRLTTVNDTLIVPLTQEGQSAANWYVVYPWLADRLNALRPECLAIADRYDAHRRNTLSQTWQAIGEFFTDVSRFLRHLVTAAKWVRLPNRDDIERSRQTTTLATEFGSNM